MPKYQLISCYIKIGSDKHTVVFRGPDEPVTYPESLVLRVVHGEDALENVVACGEVDRSPEAERMRLNLLYGSDIIEKIFPGRYTPLPVADRDLHEVSSETDAMKKPRNRKPPRPVQAPVEMVETPADEVGDLTQE